MTWNGWPEAGIYHDLKELAVAALNRRLPHLKFVKLQPRPYSTRACCLLTHWREPPITATEGEYPICFLEAEANSAISSAALALQKLLACDEESVAQLLNVGPHSEFWMQLTILDAESWKEVLAWAGIVLETAELMWVRDGSRNLGEEGIYEVLSF